MKSFILILLLCFTSFFIYAQGDDMTIVELEAALDAAYANEPLKKNAILLTPSFPAGLGLSIAYERFITKSNNLVARLDLVGIYSWEFDGIFLGPQLIYLSGKRKGHLEIGIGPTFRVTKKSSYERSVLPNAHIGFRYQKQGGSFIFRTGLGVPAGLYVGVGLVF